MKRLALADLKVPALLVALSLVPVVGGLVRLNSLARGTPAGVDDSRFFAAPLPVLIHVVAASVYALLGAFQFSTGIRRRWPNWHKKLGLLLLSCALLTAATGLWMTVAYVIPQSLQGSLLYGVRLVVGAAMLVSIVKGWLCIVRRNISGHEAWMIRAYALAQGAGTQALLFLPLMLILGHEVLGFSRDVLMSLAWGINVVVAEWLIRRRAAAAPLHAASASRARALSG
jgi:Predicted membrane protein (DUF2306)